MVLNHQVLAPPRRAPDPRAAASTWGPDEREVRAEARVPEQDQRHLVSDTAVPCTSAAIQPKTDAFACGAAA